MSHIRTQIRAALGAALTGLPTTGARVHINRTVPVSVEAGPVLVIGVAAEPMVEAMDVHNRAARRELDIEINGYCAAANADDVLDQIGLEVETAVHQVGILGGLVFEPGAVLTAVQIGLDQNYATPLGRIRMNYRTETAVLSGDPSTVV